MIYVDRKNLIFQKFTQIYSLLYLIEIAIILIALLSSLLFHKVEFAELLGGFTSWGSPYPHIRLFLNILLFLIFVSVFIYSIVKMKIMQNIAFALIITILDSYVIFLSIFMSTPDIYGLSNFIQGNIRFVYWISFGIISIGR